MSWTVPFAEEITLGTDRVSPEDGVRQARGAREILQRLGGQSGVILADEVGMGKTFGALAVATSVALARPDDGPVVVMVPSSLVTKWPRDWEVFREHCLRGDRARALQAQSANSGVELLRLLDDAGPRRKAIVFLTHGALHRRLKDDWVKLALIRRALHARKGDFSLVRASLPKFAGELLRARWIPEEVWARLLSHDLREWKVILQRAGVKDLDDDPVPQMLIEAMNQPGVIDLEPVLEALRDIPLRRSVNVEDRLTGARQALSSALKSVWRAWLQRATFHSPLLVLDEAHHLKNAETRLASLFQDEEAQEDSDEVSRGILAGVFHRMLFLTATPFQLGHHELVSVLRRFEGIDWAGPEAPAGGRAGFVTALGELERTLDDAQAAALRLDATWGRLRADHLQPAERADLDAWWTRVVEGAPGDDAVGDVVRRYRQCNEAMRRAEVLLRPWVVRHLRSRYLPSGPDQAPIHRRATMVGAAIREDRPLPGEPGLEVDGEALLPFLLAARAQAVVAERSADDRPRVAGFAQGLASSYEAYLETQQDDDVEPEETAGREDRRLKWYLDQLEGALPKEDERRIRHPKVLRTVERALELWQRGDKVLVFCHYRATGRALRRYLSLRVEQWVLDHARERLGVPSRDAARDALERIGAQFFDTDGRLRDEATRTLTEIVQATAGELPVGEPERIVEIGRRFLRTPSFLARYFPLGADDPVAAFREALDRVDGSGLPMRRRIEQLCHFLGRRCVPAERTEYLDALDSIQTGTYRRERPDADDPTDQVIFLPNVRLANGQVKRETRQRLMLAFNAPFFPEILIASSVLAEGVDLHRDCRHVIHHDLCWNPSTLEQRTGRVDRIGAKAEHARMPIHVYLPYVAATQDEKMFRVVRDRERWFNVVMGERYRTDERSTDRLAERVPLPEIAARALAFDLAVPVA